MINVPGSLWSTWKNETGQEGRGQWFSIWEGENSYRVVIFEGITCLMRSERKHVNQGEETKERQKLLNVKCWVGKWKQPILVNWRRKVFLTKNQGKPGVRKYLLWWSYCVFLMWSHIQVTSTVINIHCFNLAQCALPSLNFFLTLNLGNHTQHCIFSLIWLS